VSRLIAFGDSFTWGTDLADSKPVSIPSQNTWPALLARHLGLEYICNAVEGASNKTIVREFFNYYPNLKEDDTVIINWTWIDRWDYYDGDKWHILRPSENSSSFHKIYYKYFQSELWDKFESLKDIVLVHNLLEKLNIKYYATCVDKLVIDKTFHNPVYVNSLIDEICNTLLWFDNKGFYQWAKDNNFKISETWHPLEEAHHAAFNYIKHEITL
jgi:hypothetical protein